MAQHESTASSSKSSQHHEGQPHEHVGQANPYQSPPHDSSSGQPAEHLNRPGFTSPHPGSKQMPQWTAGELGKAPTFYWRNWYAFLGPGLVMGASAIGGGEWLTGPMVTARYGGAMLWLAALSILGQALYNIEISRYTLYCGEPIFTGKFRTLPGPVFWVIAYLFLDFGAVFPYLAASAANPIELIIHGRPPDPAHIASDWWWRKGLSTGIFLLALVPLIFGGKIYNSLKLVMSFKLVLVLGFLMVLAIFYSHLETWTDILSGFFKIGSVPVRTTDGSAQVNNIFLTLFQSGEMPHIDWSLMAFIGAMAAIAGNGGLSNTPLSNYTRDQGWGMGEHVGSIPSMVGGQGIKLSHVGAVFDPNEKTLPRWRGWYRHLSRDQLAVWAPACFVGIALPCMLSVEFMQRGTEVDRANIAIATAKAVESHVADPLPTTFAVKSGVSNYVSGATWGRVAWGLTLLCGFLVLSTSLVTTIDGAVRRWVDAFWTASPKLRSMKSDAIRYVYFYVLLGYTVLGMLMLWLNEPGALITISTTIYNYALGFSCLHVLAINLTLLPRELRPNWFVRGGLVCASIFFFMLATLALSVEVGWIQKAT